MGSKKLIHDNNKGRHVTYRPLYVRPFEARHPTVAERAMYNNAAEKLKDDYQRLSLKSLQKLQRNIMAELILLNLEPEN